MFAGFKLATGKDRFDEHIRVGGEPSDCKVSGKDTAGAMCIFEFTGTGGGPRHLHDEQDEWIYVLDGQFDFEVGDEQFRVGPGESVFLPRKVTHVWASVSGKPGKIINVYQPASKMEQFFRELGKYHGKPPIHEALTFDEFQRFFQDHGLELTGPPLTGKWKVTEGGRMIRTA